MQWPWNGVKSFFSEYPLYFLILDAIENLCLQVFDENPKARIGASLKNSGFGSNYVCVSVYNFLSEIM